MKKDGLNLNSGMHDDILLSAHDGRIVYPDPVQRVQSVNIPSHSINPKGGIEVMSEHSVTEDPVRDTESSCRNKGKGNPAGNRTRYLVQGAMIAAIYVVLTVLAAGFDLASGSIQVRFSEVLTVLPFFTPAAVPGLTIGCLLANILTGSALPDIIFGTLATLIGAAGTRLLRKHRFLCTLSPVISNGIIVPLVLRYAYGVNLPVWALMLSVGAGEAICCVLFGSLLIAALYNRRGRIFPED